MIAISPCNLWLKAVKVFICHSYVARLYGLQMVTLPWVVFSRKYQICPNGFGSIREGCHAGTVEEEDANSKQGWDDATKHQGRRCHKISQEPWHAPAALMAKPDVTRQPGRQGRSRWDQMALKLVLKGK